MSEPEAARDWFFTFGHSQPFFGCYVRIHGTFASARADMFRRFGARWSMQYDHADAFGRECFGLHELTPELEASLRAHYLAHPPEPEDDE